MLFDFISRCFYYILDQFDQETLCEMKFAVPRTWIAGIGNYLSTLIFKFSADFHNMQSVDVVSRAWFETERFNILVFLNPYIQYISIPQSIYSLLTT